MAALVGYASSDEDEEIQDEHPITAPGDKPTPSTGNKNTQESNSDTKTPQAEDASAPVLGPQLPPPDALQDAPVLGPSLPTNGQDLTAMDVDVTPEPSVPPSQPASPYSANRALLRDLTLPPVPNLDVPPSPPGSPPRSLPALTAKFETFLELKRKKGTHFNARLAQSAAMRNPALMDKLMGFVGLEDPMTAAAAAKAGGAAATVATGGGNSMADQYITILPPGLWDPTAFPQWAFRDGLREAQEKVQKQREAERASGRREAVEFVPASTQ
ncbi:hypothetical protein PpBr36_08821 [Pyricularia pennisetigena]|uniref:hypothetical protein n=1 Tax=Pyricularia pennisetigena TaxID=1578925 RepID=UPI00115437B6|nr:hypothetical protein PpBr36_08821 [Pyricularia pennisetigena]TLS24126.1 hypothetical protein PpBr36_08821 [Pyricularia pennisetigena]